MGTLGQGRQGCTSPALVKTPTVVQWAGACSCGLPGVVGSAQGRVGRRRSAGGAAISLREAVLPELCAFRAAALGILRGLCGEKREEGSAAWPRIDGTPLGVAGS